ncbi:MAG: hypothetical protein BGO43_08220 [Gammaproteobacteria bacterium 39-13]|nr:MAG: hypothetical protein BGO43_08220 [Gammaproteobacteria bacterium 39-13]
MKGFRKVTNRAIPVLLGCLLKTSFPAYATEHPLLTPTEAYNWSEIMNVPANSTLEGNQVLHLNGKNKYYKTDPKAVNIVNHYFKNAKALDSDADVLHYASAAVTIKSGYYLEMGVGTGSTANFLATLNPTRKVYGFDSFEGLPTDWDTGDNVLKAGTFGLKRKEAKIPVLKNVVVYKGFFKEVLPTFKQQVLKDNPIALLHIDSDTYDSAKDALTILEKNIKPGTVIVFDEFYNYPNFDQHEWKAFQEFIAEHHLQVEYIAYNKMHEQAVVKIL